jgi:hypothetical protein
MIPTDPDFTWFKRPSGTVLIVPRHIKGRAWLLQEMGLIDADEPPGNTILDDARIAMETNETQFPIMMEKLERAGMVVHETGRA